MLKKSELKESELKNAKLNKLDIKPLRVSQTPAFIATRQFNHADYWALFWQFGHTMALFTVSIGLMFASLSVHYSLTLILALPAIAAYVRLFMIGHDCGHESYLPKRWQNRVLGNFIGVLTNTPIGYWARQHLQHHKTTGNLDKRGDGDVMTMTVNEFQAASPFSRFCYRIYRNPFFLNLVAAPVHFVFLQRLPLGKQMKTLEGWLSVMGTNIGIALYYGSLIMLFGWKAFLLVYVPVVWLSATIAVWLFYMQHQFEGAFWKKDEEWDYHSATLQGSSFYDLPKWLHWVTGNIGFHHIHHLNPRVPNYHLEACYKSSEALQETNRLSISTSLKTAFLALWDEETERLISFAEYERKFFKESLVSD